MADRRRGTHEADPAAIPRRAALSLGALAALPTPLTAQGAAGDAAPGGSMPLLAARIEASRLAAPAGTAMLLTAGYARPGDGGGGRYARAAAKPEHQAAFQTADGAWFALAEPLVSPRHFGAVAAAGDDAPAFQAHADALFGGRLSGRAHYPAGSYRIGAKIELPYATGGGAIDGDGMLISPPYGRTALGTATMLMWSGAAGGTMIGGRGNCGLSFRDMALVGRTGPAAPRAGILLHCEQDRSLVAGSGVGLIEQVAFIDAAVGMQMGASVDDHNCADWTLIRPLFHSCDTGFLVTNKQGLNYSFLAPTAVRCGSLVRMVEGGHFYATNVQAALSGGIGEGKWLLEFAGLGDNAAIVSIDGLRVEQGTRQALRAVGGTVLLRGYEEAQRPQSCTMVELRGAVLSCDGGRLVSHGAAAPHFRLGRGPGNARPTLHLRNIHFDVAAFRIEEWVLREPGSGAVVTLAGCTYGNAREPLPIAAVNTLLTEGSVVLSGRTQGGGTTLLSADGRPLDDPASAALLPSSADALVRATVVGRRTDGPGGIAVFDLRGFVGRSPGRSPRPLAETPGVPGWITPAITHRGEGVTVEVSGLDGAAILWTASIDAVILPAAHA